MKRSIYFYTLILCMGVVFCNCGKSSDNKTPILGEKKGYEIYHRDKFYGVCFLDLENIWMVGQFGIILHTTDQGASYKLQDSKTENVLYQVDFVDRDNGWIAGSYGTILHTSDGGKNWEKQKTNKENQLLLDLDFIDKDSGWAVGSWGTILSTNNGGRKWESQSIKEDITLNCVCFVNSQEGWIGGEWGTLLHTTNGGTEWVKQESPIDTSLFGIHFTDSKQGWAVGLLGNMLHTRDGGKTWKQIDSGTKNTLLDIVVAGGFLWSVGGKGTLIKISIGEEDTKSKVVTIETNQWLPAISFLPNQHLYGCLVGARGAIFYTKDGGVNWIHKGFILS